MSFIFTKLGSTLLVIALIAFGYFLFTAIGDTTIGVTLKTNTDLERGLVGHWTFDGKDVNKETNVITDRSGQGNHGKTVGMDTATTTAIGVLGQALSFDGVDDKVPVSPATSINDLSVLTASAWVKANSYGESSLGAIVSKEYNGGEGWIFQLQSPFTNMHFYMDYDTTDLKADSAIDSFSLNEWHHVVVTWDGTSNASGVNFYKNGTLLGHYADIEQDGVGSKVVDTTRDLQIGNVFFQGRTFDGLIDDVRIYNRALSAEEIKRLYDLGATTHVNVTIPPAAPAAGGPDLATGLVGHWTFDGKDVNKETNVITDRSGQGNHGKTVGMDTATTTAIGVLGQALSFDGNGDYITVPSSSSLNTLNDDANLSVGLWYYVSEVSPAQPKYLFRLHNSSSDTIYAGFSTDTFLVRNDIQADATSHASFTGTDRVLNTWVHLIMVLNGSDISIYQDGVFKDNDVLTTNFSSLADGFDFTIAREGNGINSRTWNGLIDDVRVYNRALSADEISRLYDLGATTHVNVTIPPAAPAAGGPDLATGLVGHWTFDGKDVNKETNVITDRSGQGNHGKTVGMDTATTTAIGVLGQALEFDGGDDGVSVASASILNPTVISVSFWAKVVNYIDNNNSIFEIGNNSNNFRVRDTDGKFQLLTAGGTNNLFSATNAIDYNQWIHWTFIGNSSGLSIYKNGVLSSSNTTAYSKGADGNVYIGCSNSFDFCITASIDDVRIYNRALSADEISRLYNLGR